MRTFLLLRLQEKKFSTTLFYTVVEGQPCFSKKAYDHQNVDNFVDK